jgi:hypothetical protein
MAVRMRGSAPLFSLAAVAVLLAGCASTSNTADLNIVGQAQAPQQVQPVQQSTVSQNQLPPLGGAQGAPAPGLSGQPVLGGVQTQQQASANLTGRPGTMGASATTTQTASANGSFVSLDPLAAGVGTGPEGVWTVVSGTSQCRLNLPLTMKEGTSRYRASAPGCTLPGLASVGAWQQVGNQIQLFDEGGTLVAALAQSNGRYVGTMAGGQAISMQR